MNAGGVPNTCKSSAFTVCSILPDRTRELFFRKVSRINHEVIERLAELLYIQVEMQIEQSVKERRTAE